MKLIKNKIINWIKRETWWRRHYRRITLPEEIACYGYGKCLECSAATETDKLTCDISKGRPCPCKWYQCLKHK